MLIPTLLYWFKGFTVRVLPEKQNQEDTHTHTYTHTHAHSYLHANDIHVYIFEICFKELASRLWGLAGPRSLGQADREIRLGTPGQGLKPQPTGRISFSSGMLSLFFKASNSYWFAQQQSDARQTQDRNILKCHDLQNFSDTNTFIIKT